MSSSEVRRNSIYLDLLRLLNEEKVGYCVLRDRPECDQVLGDLDILVHSSRRSTFMEICAKCGFLPKREYGIRPYKTVMLAYAPMQIGVLDVHWKLVDRGVVYLNEEKVLERRIFNGIYYVPSNEDLLMTLILHNLLGKKRVLERHSVSIRSLLSQPLDYSYIRGHLEEVGLDHAVSEVFINFEGLVQDGELFRRASQRIYYKLYVKNPQNLLRRIGVKLARRVRILSPSRGVVVAFIGPDGSGKSTLIGAIEDRLRNFPIQTIVVYMGPWWRVSTYIKGIMSFLGLRPIHKDSGDERYHSLWRRLKRVLQGLLYYVFIFLGMWGRYLFCILPHLLRGRVVIADRYIYDLYVGFRNREVQSFRWMGPLLCSLFPRPHVRILVSCSSGRIMNRKPWINVQQLERVTELYHEVAQKYDFSLLHTDQDVESVVDEFMTLYFQRLFRLDPWI